ncbi:hypothetical protein GCM10022405_35480 [Gibbsiella dentisursi]|uniref:DUF1468 domain-containing protein n=1 Tax=Gibbsiella dentisursi TaxID=796890 RepID=A0ABP7LVL6_9GAMM
MALSFNPRKAWVELLFAILWVALAIWLYVEAGHFSAASATFPRALAVLLGICGVVLSVKSFLALRRLPAAQAARLFQAPGRVLMGFVLVLLYLLLMDWVGYIAASLLFGLVLPLLAGYRDWKQLLWVIGGTIVFIWLVFNVLLERPLPQGIVESFLGSLL